MKKIFLDTNFLLDYFVRENYMGDSEKLMVKGSEAGYAFYVSYLSIANFAFIMRKESRVMLLSLIKRICELFEVVQNTKSQIETSIDINGKDFEDVLQYAAAKEAHCDVIITRNQKDYEFSDIPVYSAGEFLKII